MKKIVESIHIQDLQEYIAFSIIQSLWIGSILVLLLLLIEFFRSTFSYSTLHKCYKYSLFLVLIGSLFGNYFLRDSNNLNILNILDLQFSYKLIYWLNIFWVVGGIIYLTKILIAQYYINRIVKNANKSFPNHWILLLNRSKEKIQYLKEITFVHSERIQSAFVTGIIKPVFVLPISWINQLSAEEAEFILIHELSHLKAKDQYVNIVCNLAEIILFYNPAVHFIVKRIRFQRELCADQMVIEHVSKPIAYATLLVRIGENPQLKPIIAFSSVKNQLGIRVKSILQLKTNVNRSMQSFFLPIFLCISALTVMNKLPTKTYTEWTHNSSLNMPFPITNKKQEMAHLIKRKKSNRQHSIEINTPIKKFTNSRKKELKLSIESREDRADEFSEPLISIHDEFNTAMDPMQFMKGIDSFASKSMVIIIKPNEYGTSSSSLSEFIKEHTYYFEKDWKYTSYPQQKLYKYFILKDMHNNILSYSFNLQNLYQISTIN